MIPTAAESRQLSADLRGSLVRFAILLRRRIAENYTLEIEARFLRRVLVDAQESFDQTRADLARWRMARAHGALDAIEYVYTPSDLTRVVGVLLAAIGDLHEWRLSKTHDNQRPIAKYQNAAWLHELVNTQMDLLYGSLADSASRDTRMAPDPVPARRKRQF